MQVWSRRWSSTIAVGIASRDRLHPVRMHPSLRSQAGRKDAAYAWRVELPSRRGPDKEPGAWRAGVGQEGGVSARVFR
jgi:hypothetical protein